MNRYDRCPFCKLLGLDALRGEQAVSGLDLNQIARHPECGHVMWWRNSGRSMMPPRDVDVVGRIQTERSTQ
jgi:hypothetical protein